MAQTIKKIILLVYFIMVYFASIGQNVTDAEDNRKWIFVGKNNDSIPVYLESKCIEKKEGIIVIKTRSIRPIYKWEGKVYKDVEVEIMYGVDCKNRLMATYIGMVFYKDKILVYKVYSEKEQKWQVNQKNSIGESILESACERF